MSLIFLDRLRPRRAPAADPVFDGLPAVRAYWEALRHRSALPHRAQLDPRGLAGMLDRVFLADPIGKGIIQIRVAGSALAVLGDTDLRGLPLSCLFTPDSRPLLAQALLSVVETPAVAEVDLGTDRGMTGRAMARLLVLPIQDDAGRRSILGAFAFAEGCEITGKLQILSRREERLTTPPQTWRTEIVAPSGQRRHLVLVPPAE